MCGIVGFVSNKKNKEKDLDKMLKRIIHRGPDGEGKYIDDGVALGHRRLSIIDIDGGSQPIFNENGNLVIIFNGEIYNYKDLRNELVKCGHVFKTGTDTEVIIHGYEEYGSEIVTKLRGMFAFVIWNKDNNELFGARDHFGIKPFYYYYTEKDFMFASEIKAFVDHSSFVKELNRDIIPSYLCFNYSPTNDTFFKNVYKLEPGYYFKYKNGKLDLCKYFSVTFDETSSDFDKLVDDISKTMKESVEHHMISDVPVGSFLSSGIDSSYIVSLAKPDKTFTVGSDNPKYDETKYAKDLANKLGIVNISKSITKEEYINIIPKLMYHFDEPVADPAAIALYFVAELASHHVKVVLSGEGADEFFGGYGYYRRYIDAVFYNKLPFWFRRCVSKVCSLLPEVRGINFLVRSGKTLEEDYISVNKVFSEREARGILNFKANYLSNKEITASVYAEQKNQGNVTKMQAVDIKFWLVKDILQKADKMTMANSIEGRVPFTDISVFKLARTISYEHKITRDNTKVALRQAAKSVIPTDAYNKEKLGFPVPLREWVREDDVYNMILDKFNSPISLELFNNKRIVKLLDDHRNRKRDNYKKVWAIYCFLVWYDEFFVKI
ncbi:MAG: asparagine synthase (glutamine-hydrolyzing) [Bacilli bacterium]|nr:asparagine synthase (glutamine-hydrolyzing) [Bacilli bacterium]